MKDTVRLTSFDGAQIYIIDGEAKLAILLRAYTFEGADLIVTLSINCTVIVLPISTAVSFIAVGTPR